MLKRLFNIYLHLQSDIGKPHTACYSVT